MYIHIETTCKVTEKVTPLPLFATNLQNDQFLLPEKF